MVQVLLRLKSSTSFWMKRKVTTPRHTVMVRGSGPSAVVPFWWMVSLLFPGMKLSKGKNATGLMPSNVTRRWHGWRKNIRVPLTEPPESGDRVILSVQHWPR
ncbi:hypothetical protein KZ779_08800 [Escherichia coli]|nr:hypothetical protein [Escherichia coli]